MKFEDFKVGDRVVVIKSDIDLSYGAFSQGEEGTVVIADHMKIGVVFDEYNPHRHDLYHGGLCEVGHGYYFGDNAYPQAAEFLAVQMEDSLPDFNFDPDNYRDLVQTMK